MEGVITIKILNSYIFLIVEFIFFIILSLTLLCITNYSNLKTECFKAYLYSSGYMYIGDKECIDTIKQDGTKLLIQDARSGNDPDIKIYDSYKIKDEQLQKEILDKLLYYEEIHPSDWERTKTSMVNEWYAHNLLYNMNYKRERTRDVDLDNNDEETFKEKLGVNTLIKYFNK